MEVTHGPNEIAHGRLGHLKLRLRQRLCPLLGARSKHLCGCVVVRERDCEQPLYKYGAVFESRSSGVNFLPYWTCLSTKVRPNGTQNHGDVLFLISCGVRKCVCVYVCVYVCACVCVRVLRNHAFALACCLVFCVLRACRCNSHGMYPLIENLQSTNPLHILFF